MSFLTALQNIISSEAVSVAVSAASSYSAVEAVIFAEITDFDKPSYIYGIAVYPAADAGRFFGQDVGCFRAAVGN